MIRFVCLPEGERSWEVGRKKVKGFVFEWYKGDHPPLHVHVYRGRAFIGRWDIEHQRPMDNFRVDARLRRALKTAGYLLES